MFMFTFRLLLEYCCCCSMLGVIAGALGIGPLCSDTGPDPGPAIAIPIPPGAAPEAAAGFEAAAARMFHSSRFRYLASSLSGSLLESVPGPPRDDPPATPAGADALGSAPPPYDRPPPRFYVHKS